MFRITPTLLRLATAALFVAVVAACGGEPPVGSTKSLTVTVAGGGTGTVVSAPSGINVTSGAAPATASFATGAEVTLTATAAAGSVFTGWSGACSGTAPCDLTMDANESVTATFNLEGVEPTSYTLTVSAIGDGEGSVVSAPAGIDLLDGDASDAFDFDAGTAVTLTATPATGSVFVGWSGGGCSGQGTCAVTMNAATSVSADFQLEGATVASFSILAGADDAEEYTKDINVNFPTGAVDLGSGDLDLTHDTAAADVGARERVVVGLRYGNVTIPRNALVTSATITFTRRDTQLGSVTFDVTGHASDSAPAFQGGLDNLFDISSRPRTTASVEWLSPTGEWTAVATADSADLAAIVQELVNRSGWSAGNALAFIISSDDSNATNLRRADAFEGGTAPSLSVSYYIPTAP